MLYFANEQKNWKTKTHSFKIINLKGIRTFLLDVVRTFLLDVVSLQVFIESISLAYLIMRFIANV